MSLRLATQAFFVRFSTVCTDCIPAHDVLDAHDALNVDKVLVASGFGEKVGR
ncbi:MAG: hypothetical protein MRY72_11325 [Aquisalinus sp.]|nr:hypothetical protein [Aquisalinus sp.]